MLNSNNPKLKNKRGFAQISKDTKIIEVSSLEVDDIFNVMSETTQITAKVIKKSNFN